MKKTAWVFGSMLAAGCMLLSVPVTAQGNLPQGMPGGMGRNPGFQPGGAGMPGAPGAMGMPGAMGAPGTAKANPAAGTAARTGAAATAKTNTAKNDKALQEAQKYTLSKQRTDLIRVTVDGYAATDDLSDPATVIEIREKIKEHMPLVPSVPLEKIDTQALNDKAKKKVEEEFGADEKKYASVVEAEAAAEYPIHKIGDKVVVNYNMGPKHFSVKGTVYRITDNAITVEDKVINLVDLNDETRSKFDPQMNKTMRARYIETHNHLIKRLQIEKIQDYYDKFKNEIFKRNETAGYIYDPQTGDWSTAQELCKNYIDRVLKDKKRSKPNAGSQQQPPKPATTVAAIDDNEQEDDPVDETPAVETGKQNDTVKTGSSRVNDAIKIDDNEESKAKHKSVLAKAEQQKQDANENYAGIDADCGYKNACWGFTIADSRYALWQEPEFPYIKPALGRDIISFPPEGLDVGIAGEPASIDLVYVSNSLSKVVFIMKDCSRQDFLRFKDSLTEQYGHAAEDRGVNSAAFNNIFSGKTKPQQIIDADEIAAAQAAVKDAEKAFNKADANLKDAGEDDDRGELQEARDEAAAELKEAIAKAESYENAVSSDDLPYVYSRVKLAKDDGGNTVLPYAFNWKGQKVSGTLVFYYDKARDKVTNLVFAKEYKK
jgi:hypothetical protein